LARVPLVILALAALRGTAQAQAPMNFKPVNYQTGLSPYFVAVGDINGDGLPDLVTANIDANTVSVLLGKDHGAFQPHLDSAAGQGPRSVAIGDFNGDGKPDLAVANGTSPGTVSILLGNGDGTFQPPVGYETGNISSSVAVGDFNNDGKLDLAVSNYSSDTVSVLLGNGDGTFQTHLDYATGYGPQSVAVKDFNGDGKLDLAVVNYYGENSDYQGPGSVSTLLGQGDGTFGGHIDYQTGAGSVSIAIGDFNGDGIPDLAVANACGRDNLCLGRTPGTVSILLGVGNGTFQSQVDYWAGYDTLSVAVADFNGDGKLDLTVANLFDSTIGVLPGNGDGTFQKQTAFPAGSPASIATGYFAGNGRGSADIVATNLGDYNTTIVTVFLNVAGSSEKLTASPNPVVQGEAVALTVGVKAAVPGTTATPTGRVTFTDGSTLLGTFALADGLATLTTSSLPPGKNKITAAYSGDANFNPNLAQVLVKVE
jgi:hypothetical protein